MEREIDTRKTISHICIKLLEVKYDNMDISDIGNEVGFGIGSILENMTQ